MSPKGGGADSDPRLVRIAEAIAEGWTVDWAWEERAHSDDGPFLERLRILRSLVAAISSADENLDGSHGNVGAIGTWGRLVIRAKLGEGAFGEVYRAYDPLLDREVALKLSRATDSSNTQRFVLEARRLARARHPNVLVVHGADVLHGRVGIWSDLLQGKTLAEHLASEGTLSPREAALIGADLCRALSAVHKEGIVHRDLKASNVMREPDGRVVLMDFGSGGELQEGRTDPSGYVYGTPLLMAPEQLRGEPIGPQADIYSLGVLLYHAVSGEYPITASSLTELYERHLKAEPVPLRTRNPDLPRDFVKIIDRSIHTDPKQRFQTAREMEHELSAYIGPRNDASIAVLPFVNRSANADDEYFSDGLSDELLQVLAEIPGIRVAARTSSASFKGTRTTVAEVGRILNVAAVLEGSVRKIDNRVRVSVQLVKVSDGYHLWSGTYDRALDDILVVQEDIARSVVKELRTTLLGEAAASDESARAKLDVLRAAKGRTTLPEAHRSYLMARHFMDGGTREASGKAIEYLRRAVEIDPKFALGWTELSRAYAEEAHFGWIPGRRGSWKETGRKWFGEAKRAVERALTLEPDLAEAHARMGLIQLRYDLDWRRAEASMARALELSPGNSLAIRGAALVARILGRVEESVELYREALERDPLSAICYQHLGISLECLDRLAEAEVAFRRSVDLAPQKVISRALLSLTLLAQGRLEEAMVEAQLEPDDLLRLWAMAIILTDVEGQSEVDLTSELIDKYGDGATFQIAEVCGVRGEADEAFEWLERAWAQRDGGLTDLKTSPRLRSLHGDPRWRPMLEKVGLAG